MSYRHGIRKERSLMLNLCRYPVMLLVGLSSVLFVSCIHEDATPPVVKSAVVELYQSSDGELESKLPRKISLNDTETLALILDQFKQSSGDAVPPGGWVAAIVIRFDDGYNTRTVNSNYEFWWEGQSNHRVKNPPFLRKLIEQVVHRSKRASHHSTQTDRR